MTMIVVVVDDDPEQLVLLQDSLALSGASVHAFRDAEAAMASPVWAAADAAVIDWMMPGTGGLDVVSWVERTHPHVRRIVLTAAPDALVNAHPAVRDHAQVIDKSDFPTGLLQALGLRAP